MVINFKNLRVPASYPVYPPYHKGDYLEEYFYKFYKNNKSKFDEINRTLIPIFWTNVYITGKNTELLQPYLDSLPRDKKYFTVSQHDDAVSQILPPDTISFEAGGNRNGVPIPLICSPIEKEHLNTTKKDIFCSYVGSISNNAHCRVKLYQTYSNDPDFYFSQPRYWTPSVPQDKFDEFINITKRSIFSLCPKGYGKQSFRLYEVIQLGSVPIFVYTDKWFPFKKFINWDKFCVLIHENEIHSLKNKLLSYNKIDIKNMLAEGRKIYNEYFTMEGMSRGILKYLQNEK